MDYKLEEKIEAEIAFDDLSRGFFMPNCNVYSKEENGGMEILIKEVVGNRSMTIKFKKKQITT